jgi:hypothetical protein
MREAGEALREVFENTLLEIKGADVFIYENWQSEQMSSIEARSIKERGKSYFEFPLNTRVKKDDVVQIKNSQDFWRVLDTEEEYKYGVAVKLHVRVTKVDQSGNEIRLNSEGRANSYTTNIQGHNYGGIQQGGQNNTQTNIVTISRQFEEATNKLLVAVEESQNINPIQKIKVKGDVQVLKELAPLEKTPEVIQEAGARIGAIQSVLSTTADLVSLGMVVIPMIRAAFGG